jgi:hypothetical protein
MNFNRVRGFWRVNKRIHTKIGLYKRSSVGTESPADGNMQSVEHNM